MLQRLSICLAALLLAACGSYDFTVNDKVVYTPEPLFSDYEIPDAALQDCIKQAIIDENITSAAELQVLNCSHAGIVQLEGLSTFTALQRVKLSANNITNLAPMTSLSTLEILYLDDNTVVDPVPLYQLTNLQQLDLSGNDTLLCPKRSALILLETLTLPKHCPQ